jgi:hypothetical protein
MNYKKIIIVAKAKASFIKDLDNNNIPYEYLKGFHTLKIKDSPKLQMALREVRGRFGSQSIKVDDLI